MEQITRKDGEVYYGSRKCLNINEAYSLFRNDYHRSLGRDPYGRLDRLGQRKERVHEFGFVFSKPKGGLSKKILGSVPVKYWLLGMLGISYCRLVGEGLPGSLSDNEFDDWFDYVFQYKSGCLRLIGRKDGFGRTK